MTSQERKPRRTGRKRRAAKRSTQAVQALAAASVLAAGTQAYAAPVRFENPAVGDPAHFDWNPGGDFQNALYVQLPPAEQGNANYVYGGGFGGTYYLPGPRAFNRTLEVPIFGSTTPAYTIGRLGANMQSDTGFYGLTLGLNAGETIPSSSGVFETLTSIGQQHQSRVRDPATTSSLIPEGTPSYIPVRITDVNGGSGYNYGWIGVVRTADDLSVFAWGYETQVGVPIAAGVPEPGSLALLAFGAAAALIKRRN